MKATKLSLLLLAAALAACGPARKKDLAKDKSGKSGDKPAAAEAAPIGPATDVQEASLRVDMINGERFEIREELKNVPFDYDSAKLSDEALAILKANAELIKKDKLTVAVAGHCDERGTIAYNLALGQKRAKEVRDYYIRLGVDGRRVATISYGKEKGLCADSTEECWSKNRRGETLVKTKSDSAQK